jgi:Flp pilus assembly protein TadB
MDDDHPGSNGLHMSGKRRYGDPRKSQAQESPKQAGESSKREFSGGSLFFIFFAWIVFFVLWLAVGSLLVAAIVFGVLLSGGIAVLNAS